MATHTQMHRARTVLVVLLAAGLAAAPGARAGVLRMHDRSISAAAPKFSATATPGQLLARVAVRVDNRGRKSLAVAASDFALSAQADLFRTRTWDARAPRLKIGPGRSRAVRLTFAVPRVAREHASLFYRAAGSGHSGSVRLGRRPPAAPRALSSATTISTFWATAGVGEPWGTAVDATGNVWFAEPGCDFAPTCSASAKPGQIGVLKASSRAISFYTLPSIPGNQPIFLAFDPSGNLWFTTPNNSMIGEFDPVSRQFVGQWPVTPGSGPWDLIFVGGRIWYTEHFVSAVGSFDPSTHTYRDYQTPTANSNPYGIAADGALLWFTENNSSVDRIASLDSVTGAISEYPIVRPLSGTPHLVAIDGSGHPWWTEGWSNTIATLNPATATADGCGVTSGPCNGIQRFKPAPPSTCSTSGTHTSGIAFHAASGLVWFDNSLTAQVGSFNAASSSFAMTSLSNCSAHPHDGLSPNALGNVWFDEEFVNAIGLLVPSATPPAASAPAVATGPASAAGTTAATVTGTVNPNGQATTYHFDYGTGTGYGSQAPAPPDPSAGSGTAGQTVSANLSGLSPGTMYHYRLVATNASGTSYGADQAFTTATASVGVLATDSFNRSVNGGWGAAEVGGSWNLLDPAAVWSVAPGAGSVDVAAGGQARAVLGGAAAQDVDLLATVVLPLCTGGGNCDSFLLGRYTAAGYYRVGAVQGQRSTVYLRAQRDDGTFLVNDVDSGIPADAGAVLRVRVQFQGASPTMIRARVWPLGAPEPATWLLITRDSTAAEQTAGTVGIRARNEDTSAVRTFGFQSFQATALGP